MARAALPESRLRAKRRARIRKRLGILAGILVLICIGIILFLCAPFIQIKTIEVEGTQALSSKDIEALVVKDMSGDILGLIPKTSIFIYPHKQIERDLLHEFPTIKTLSIERTTFSKISIKITERSPLALWCGEKPEVSSQCLLMDESATVYAPAVNSNSSVYISYYGMLASSTLPAQFISSEEFHALVPLVDALSQKVQLPDPQYVYIDDQNDVYVHWPNGFELRFSGGDNGGKVVEDFGLALQSDPFKTHSVDEFSYLDLRFGTKLYYKLKP